MLLLEHFDVPVIRRALHFPSGNSKYSHAVPPVPEAGICWDFLSHPSIDWQGNVFICNRLDTENKGLLGNLEENTLDELWNGPIRTDWLHHHLKGHRDRVPACKNCLFYGIPATP